ncbi:MAG: hypothetical protein AAFX08_06000 [Pseudomonadota bacterium]
MKAFELPADQIATIVSALVADELGRRFRRRLDSLSAPSPALDAALGVGGLGLSQEEIAACALRATAFFHAQTDEVDARPQATLAEWAGALSTAVRRRLVAFSFTAAGGAARQPFDHLASDIFAEAAGVSSLIYGRRRLVSFVAPHSLLGFVLTVLAPNLQQIPRLDARGMTPETLNETLAFGDVVVATPSIWRFLAQEGARAPDNVIGVYFGEPMDAGLSSQLRTAGFSAQREIYGSTETGLIGWRDSPGRPFQLFDALLRNGDALERIGADRERRKIEPPDHLEWRDARSFEVGARRDGAVQIGAVNVFPIRIATVVEAHADVESCRIDVGRHSGGFDRLIARIVLRDGLTPSEGRARSIDRHCRERLEPHERPRIYKFEDDAAE